MTSEVSPDPGSFRDPLSRVFPDDDRVLRGVRAEGVDDYRAFAGSGLLDTLVAAGKLVPTSEVDSDLLGADWDLVLSQPRLDFISYPYEWPFSMLKRAAELQLQLTASALDHDLVTKDATPYNVQFEGTTPRFIDVGSFEKLRPGTPWFGYRQFCQQFLNPLLLQAYRDVPFRPWLRGRIEGITPSEMCGLLRPTELARPGVLVNVVMHARADRSWSKPDARNRTEMAAAGFGKAVLQAQIKKLARIVSKLEWKPRSSEWSEYSDRPHYEEADLLAKSEFVRSVSGTRQRRVVWDLGANDGHFSRLVAADSKLVLALDSDELVVDDLFRRLEGEGNEVIVPLVMDVIDGSPSQGWRNIERPSFLSRSDPDLVLALALVHHMCISGTVPPAEVVEFLVSLSSEVVLEVPHRDDPMVEGMLASKRTGVFDGYGLEAFETALGLRMDVKRTELLPGGTRTMFHAVPRS